MFNERTRQDTVFKTESALSTSYSPPEPIDRTAEIEQIAQAVQPLSRGQPPENILVHGPAGSGKTTAIEYVLERLEKQTSTKSVHINCIQYNTRSSLLCQLLIELGYPVPRKGKAVDELLEKLLEWLNKNRSAVLALEEFDQLQDQTEIVYDLHETSKQATNHLGLILASNSDPRDILMDPRSQSRLNYRRVAFDPYTKNELYEILRERAKTAFQPGCVSDDALALIAGRVAEQRGDCRHAIELLHRAGRIADRDNSKTVRSEHAKRSFNPART